MSNYLSRLAGKTFGSPNVIRPKKPSFFLPFWSNSEAIVEELYQLYPQADERTGIEKNSTFEHNIGKRNSETSSAEILPDPLPSLQNDLDRNALKASVEMNLIDTSGELQLKLPYLGEHSGSYNDEDGRSLNQNEIYADLSTMTESSANCASPGNRHYLNGIADMEKSKKIDESPKKPPFNEEPLRVLKRKILSHSLNNAKDSAENLSYSEALLSDLSIPAKKAIADISKPDNDKTDGERERDFIEEKISTEAISYHHRPQHEVHSSPINKTDTFEELHAVEGTLPHKKSELINPIIYQNTESIPNTSQKNKESFPKATSAKFGTHASEDRLRSETLNKDTLSNEFMAPSASIRSPLFKEPSPYHISPIPRPLIDSKLNAEMELSRSSRKNQIISKRILSKRAKEIRDIIKKEIGQSRNDNRLSEDDFLPRAAQSPNELKADRFDERFNEGLLQPRILKAYRARSRMDQKSNLPGRSRLDLSEYSSDFPGQGQKSDNQVQVNIGTIEVKATTPLRKEINREPTQIMRLDDYLRKRSNGAGE
jgi:hypothetical protein